MNIGSTTGSALSTGYAQSTNMMAEADNRITAAAQQVAGSMSQRPVEETAETTEALVDMQEGKQLVSAAGKLVEAQNTQVGSLLDIQA